MAGNLVQALNLSAAQITGVIINPPNPFFRHQFLEDKLRLSALTDWDFFFFFEEMGLFTN